ncbi:hypothetical protein F511_31984 [Dorcoceras hygrometricum]|uniref:Uncharacterized protein n=1 Tax=Dorcoceras hygrometricum TaxID=472368 RepID=A0A2Z7D669_9LAMI|nr:hypothetical protein F511_31984 [Dorcoceras hygrometricum]
MASSSSSSSSSSSFPLKIALSLRPPAIASKNLQCLYRTSIRRLSYPFLTSKSPDLNAGLLSSPETIERYTSLFPVAVGRKNAATIESAEEDIPVNRVPDPKTKNDAVEDTNEESVSMNVTSEGLGEHKMDRADNEDNPEMKHKLLRLARKLREIDEDVLRHNKLLDEIRKSSSDVGDIVTKRRKDFTKEFFLHLHTVSESFYDNPADREAIVEIADRCLAAVQTYDLATESLEALTAAEGKFEDIVNSPTLDAACRKIDSLAEKNQLDSTLVLMISKAWSAAKESNMMKDEVKDVLYHLYKTARGNLQRLMPKEIRILKYLLTIEDPEERMSALKDAFAPGEELEGNDVDSLYTTPTQLHTWIRTIVDAYHFSREGSLIREARDLMNPKIVQKMEELTKIIQDHFM